jgi:hypothetical protein
MRIRYVTIFLASLLLIAWLALPISGADTKLSIEYKVKAAFLYNFLKFVEWPDDQKADVNAPIVIGLLCHDDVTKVFDELASRKVKDRSIIVKRFADFKSAETKAELTKCQIVFITTCEQEYSKDAITLLHKLPILVIGESEGFLEAGGVINFIMQEGKVCFEINAKAADEVNLKVASQLLRLAKRIIKSEKTKTSKSDNMTFWNIGGA